MSKVHFSFSIFYFELVFPPLSAAPTSPPQGAIFHDAVSKKRLGLFTTQGVFCVIIFADRAVICGLLKGDPLLGAEPVEVIDVGFPIAVVRGIENAVAELGTRGFDVLDDVRADFIALLAFFHRIVDGCEDFFGLACIQRVLIVLEQLHCAVGVPIGQIGKSTSYS